MIRSILLIGASGQLGHALAGRLNRLGKVTALAYPAIDLAAPEQLRRTVRAVEPDLIVNAGAYTAVDAAENDRARAFAVNADGPQVLAQEAATIGAGLVHYSTDYVYDGAKSDPYVEDDPPAPLSVYGRSKLAGDQAVLGWTRSLVLRTSWLVSEYGSNFVRTMLRLCRERDGLRVVDDQHGAPTSAALLAETTVAVLERLRDGEEPCWGLYHCTAAGDTTWFGLARHVIDRARAQGYPVNLPDGAIVPVRSDEYPATAVRPANSRLDTTKLRRTFAVVLPDWTVGVDAAVDALIREGA